MRSMTGYGRGSAECGGRQMTVELRAVNHRYLDLSFRMPRALNFLEDAARKMISQRLARGHLDAYVTYKNLREDGKSVSIDPALLLAYERALDEISELVGKSGRGIAVKDDRSLTRMAQMDGVLTLSEADEDREALGALFAEVLGEALSQMCDMRAREGDSMAADIAQRLDALERIAEAVEARHPDTIAEYMARLKARVAELLAGAQADEGRLLQEVALMADRSAVAEETVRLRSHIAQMREMLASPEPLGRKLDFLVQELNREVNTISSKSQDVPITRLTLDAKAEIEKIREQVQNIE